MTTPCPACWADDPKGGAANGCPVCAKRVLEDAVEALSKQLAETGRIAAETVSGFAVLALVADATREEREAEIGGRDDVEEVES